MSGPMSEERLAEIRQTWADMRRHAPIPSQAYTADVRDLLADVDRLTADLADAHRLYGEQLADRDRIADRVSAEYEAEVARLTSERDEAEIRHERMFDDVPCGLQTGPGEYCDYQRLGGLPRCEFHLPAYVTRLTAELREAERQRDEAKQGVLRYARELRAFGRSVERGDPVLAAHLIGMADHFRAAVSELAEMRAARGGQPAEAHIQPAAPPRPLELRPDAPTDVGPPEPLCVLTVDDQVEYWPDCEPCGGSGGLGDCPTCEVGPAETCATCGGMGKRRPGPDDPRWCPKCDRHAHDGQCDGPVLALPPEPEVGTVVEIVGGAHAGDRWARSDRATMPWERADGHPGLTWHWHGLLADAGPDGVRVVSREGDGR